VSAAAVASMKVERLAALRESWNSKDIQVFLGGI